MADLTPEERRAATVLMKYGGYEEADDAMEWLRRESADVAAALRDGRPVMDVLEDTAYIDPSDHESVATGYAVAQELGCPHAS